MHDKLLLFQILKHFRYIAILCMIGTNFVQGMLTKVLGCYYTRIIFTDVCMFGELDLHPQSVRHMTKILSVTGCIIEVKSLI